MKAIPLIILGLSLALGFSSTWAKGNNEDADLSFLPPVTNEDTTAFEGALKTDEAFKKVESKSYKFSVDNVLQSSHLKDPSERLFNPPNQKKNPNWNNLTQIDLISNVPLSKSISFKTDVILNAYTREGETFKGSNDLRVDLKESYLSWQKNSTEFFDVGRVNIKNGSAMGFNPTDYFKVGTVLDRNTEDVSQLRDARLGALLVQGQKLWEGGSATLVVSPKISDKSENWQTNKEIIGLNLHKSNDRSRTLLKLTHALSDEFSPELIYYNESGNHNFGLNLSKVINKQWFAYVEWNIGARRSLVDEAFYDARESKHLHLVISQKFGIDKGEQYLQQTAIGASFTSASNITTKLEYHYNEAGLSKSDIQSWFDLGLNAKSPAEVGQLLSIRSLAQSRAEALGKHRLFLHSTWQDASIDDLDLTGLVIMDINDNSHLMQVKLAYTPTTISKNTELSLQFATFNGDNDTIYGSVDQENTLILGISYDF